MQSYKKIADKLFYSIQNNFDYTETAPFMCG